MLASDDTGSETLSTRGPSAGIADLLGLSKRLPRRPWRSATLAASAQLPVLAEAYFLDVAFTMLVLQIVLVAIVGLLLVLAEVVSITRWGLTPIGQSRPSVTP